MRKVWGGHQDAYSTGSGWILIAVKGWQENVAWRSFLVVLGGKSLRREEWEFLGNPHNAGNAL